MCFGRKPEFITETETETNSPAESPVVAPATFDFGAAEEALFGDANALPPVQAAETETPGEVVETMEIILIGSGPMPLGLMQLLSGLLESESGEVELGPMVDTFPFARA